MSCLYVTEQGAKITVEPGKIVVECRDGMRRLVPEQTLESIVIFGNVVLTLPAQKRCLEDGISVTMLSTGGHYFGRLVSTSHMNARRLKKQIYLSDNSEQTLLLGKKIMSCKIHNQKVLLRRYARNNTADISDKIREITALEKVLERSNSLDQLLGYEGAAARAYFDALSRLIRPEFAFKGRNRRPPKDPFNAMISLGYTILFYEIFAEIENRSLSPYVGFIHRIKENHPALVSDFLEEWRAVIVDATVMSMIQGNEISPEDFQKDEETEGIFLNKKALQNYIRKLESKMRSSMHYLDYLENPVSFRKGIWWQIKSLSSCVDNSVFTDYDPLRIR